MVAEDIGTYEETVASPGSATSLSPNRRRRVNIVSPTEFSSSLRDRPSLSSPTSGLALDVTSSRLQFFVTNKEKEASEVTAPATRRASRFSRADDSGSIVDPGTGSRRGSLIGNLRPAPLDPSVMRASEPYRSSSPSFDMATPDHLGKAGRPPVKRTGPRRVPQLLLGKEVSAWKNA
jgi:hypothetical protein